MSNLSRSQNYKTSGKSSHIFLHHPAHRGPEQDWEAKQSQELGVGQEQRCPVFSADPLSWLLLMTAGRLGPSYSVMCFRLSK